MSSEARDPSALKHTLEQITKHCGEVRVAKNGALELAKLCRTLTNHLGERSLTPQQSNYGDLESELVRVEESMAGWAKYGLIKSIRNEKDVKAGIAGCVEKLKSMISQPPVTVRPTPSPVSSNRGVNPSNRGIIEENLPRVGGEVGTSVVTATGYNDHGSRLHHTVEPESTEGHPSETSQLSLLVRRLDGVKKLEERPFDRGPHCEIWKGIWEKGREEEISGNRSVGKGMNEKADSEKVALRALLTVKLPGVAREGLKRELPRWADLHKRRPNILPFYGITFIESRLYMVLPWREEGNLLAYVKRRREPDKVHLLHGSASGLSYLHSRGLVHGNVRCNNVLISDEGEPQICDFGIAGIVEEANRSAVSKSGPSEAIVRYGAPEVIEVNNAPTTKQSDTYSFAMMMLECITEKKPFPEIVRDAEVIHARTSKKQRPPRPDGQDRRNRVSDKLWVLMECCWSVEPERRPTMDGACLVLAGEKDQSNPTRT